VAPPARFLSTTAWGSIVVRARDLPGASHIARHLEGWDMGRRYDELDPGLREWIGAQPLFFVATAPMDIDGHVNLSPKGGNGTFHVLGPTTVAYVDLVGSGIETVAHLRENGRVVLMFCAFSGPPKIVRLHGRGRVVQTGEPEFAALLTGFTLADDVREVARSIVVVDLERITDSCGFVVPRMEYAGDRDQLFRSGALRRKQQGAGWKAAYQSAKNAVSIDGLPGLDISEQAPDEETAALSSAGRAL